MRHVLDSVSTKKHISSITQETTISVDYLSNESWLLRVHKQPAANCCPATHASSVLQSRQNPKSQRAPSPLVLVLALSEIIVIKHDITLTDRTVFTRRHGDKFCWISIAWFFSCLFVPC